MHYYNSALRELCGAGAAGGGVRGLSVVCRSWFWGLCPLFVEVGFGVFSLIVDEIGCCFLALFGFFCDF